MKIPSKVIASIGGLLILVTMSSCAILYGEPVSTPQEPWEQYGVAAEESIINQQYDLAEENERKSREEYSKLNNVPVTLIMDTRNAARIYTAQGKYAWAAIAQKGDTEALKKFGGEQNQIGFMNLILSDIYLLQGDYDEACKCIEVSLNNYKSVPSKNGIGTGIGNVIKYMGRFFLEVGEYEDAKLYFMEDLDDSIKTLQISQNIAKAKNNVGLAYYAEGNYGEAEKYFGGAAGQNVNTFAVFPENLATNVLMLGKIAEHKGENDEALKRYQSVIHMLERSKVKDFPGIYRVEQSDAWYQIGRFQLKQDKPDEADKAYREAMALRQATATQTHPNYADALRGMAGVALLKGDLTSATLRAEKSLNTLDASLVPTHPRITPTLIALGSIYELTGKPEKAAPLNARIDTILQKPLGPWKEDFMETAAFYTNILKKGGKTAAAAHLEELQARQKDKRAPR